MCPRLEINDRQIADVPDESGVYQTKVGPVGIDMSLIAPNYEVQRLVLLGNIVKGRRTVELNPQGLGATQLSNNEILIVQLQKPIREKRAKWLLRERMERIERKPPKLTRSKRVLYEAILEDTGMMYGYYDIDEAHDRLLDRLEADDRRRGIDRF